MKFFLQNKLKISQFVTILSLFKNCNEFINIEIKKEKGFYIQTMDKSRVCLCECFLSFDWFNNVDDLEKEFKCSLSSVIFHNIINAINLENMGFVFEMNTNDDNLKINTFNELNEKVNKDKKDSSNSINTIKFDKYFVIPLINEQQDLLEISQTNYNVEFDINTKILSDILHQISLFGSVLKISCNEDKIVFLSSKESSGEMTAVINTDDLESFSIDEGLELDLDFSLSYLIKYCMTQKLTENVSINISSEYPAKITYILSESSNFSFYIAPKISEE